jgi:apolipoprotein D and lipocalin family protein
MEVFMKYVAITLISIGHIFVSQAVANNDLITVPYVDLNQYAGKWYQISRNILPFEQGCVCSLQELRPAAENTIAVYNTCNQDTPEGALREIRGLAYNDNPGSNSQFTVDFGLPVLGKYWIIAIGEGYKYAVVSDPSKRSLYILSKTPTLESSLYQEAVEEAAKQVDISKLQMTLQENCTYPTYSRY